METRCTCSCGKVQFAVHGRPLLRGFCHCTICQEFNQAPFADFTLFRAKDVDIPAAKLVDFRAYRPPPAAQRGKCRSCGSPVLEIVQIFPLPKLIIVPSKNILDSIVLPKPSLHVFYHRRVADVDDDLPKFNGYWKSQLAFCYKVLASIARGGARAG